MLRMSSLYLKSSLRDTLLCLRRQTWRETRADVLMPRIYRKPCAAQSLPAFMRDTTMPGQEEVSVGLVVSIG